MSKAEDKPKQKAVPGGLKYVFGGLAGMGATCFVQPMDVVKTRMQVQGSKGGSPDCTGALQCASKIFAEQGVPGLYKGIGAGLLRQATYTTGRMGVYTQLNDAYKAKYTGTPTIGASMTMGVIAGAVGAFIGTPAEVCLIRMAADAAQPPEKRRNYKNVVNAIARITKEEGVLNLWRGVVPTVQRAMIINMSQLASYSQFKNYFKNGPMKIPEGFLLHLCASMCSGLLTTVVSMPMDMAKTRLQNQNVTNKEYSGTMDVLTKVATKEGPLALWKGFTPYFCRVAPHTVLTFVFLEQFNNAYNKFVLGNEGKSSGL